MRELMKFPAPDRGDKALTASRARYFRRQTVWVSLVVGGVQLPCVSLAQCEANRLITALSDAPGDIGMIVK